MIEINLLPGARRAGRRNVATMNVGDVFAGLAARIKDPLLVFAVVSVLVAIGGVAFLHLRLGAREAELVEAETRAAQDSARFATVLEARAVAQAQRDSLLRQLNVIRTIDGERYVWPHLLDELSEALPPYTWLRSVQQTSPVVSLATRDEGAAEGRENPLALRVGGMTVDIQALTRYMRMLEASPFIEGVTLVRSELTTAEGFEVTEFTLTLSYQMPDSSAIRTVPLPVLAR